MKLWVDDFREAPDETWTVARKVQPAINALATFAFDEISLDHDIEYRPDDETFQPVAWFIECLYKLNKERGTPWNPKVKIHSDNPVGAEKMQSIMSSIEAPWEPYTKEADFKAKYGLE